MTKRIPLGRILMPKKTVTAGMNIGVLITLGHLMRSTTENVKPIKVRREGDYYRITDGRHRFMASAIAGRSHVRARVEE